MRNRIFLTLLLLTSFSTCGFGQSARYDSFLTTLDGDPVAQQTLTRPDGAQVEAYRVYRNQVYLANAVVVNTSQQHDIFAVSQPLGPILTNFGLAYRVDMFGNFLVYQLGAGYQPPDPFQPFVGFAIPLQPPNEVRLAFTVSVVTVLNDQEFGLVGSPINETVFLDQAGNPTFLTDEPAQFTDFFVTESWQNPDNFFDVNKDTVVSPIDALLIINQLILMNPLPPHSPGPGDPCYDVDGDGGIAPRDAMMVINRL